MVHALREAHRVLKPHGVLIDLRPATRHRRAGLGQDKRWQLVGVMQESLADDRAADAAVAHVIQQGLFRSVDSRTFELDRVMDTQDDLQAWLDDFVPNGKTSAHELLAKRMQAERKKRRSTAKIVVRERLKLNLLRKQI